MLRRGDTLQSRLKKKDRASGRRYLSVRSGQQQSMEASSWRLELCLLDCLLFSAAHPSTLDQRYLSLHPTESERQQAWDLCMLEMRFMPEGCLRVLLVSTSQPDHPSLQLPDHVYLSAVYLTLCRPNSLCQWDTASRRGSSNQPVYLDKCYYVSLGIMSLCDKT